METKCRLLGCDTICTNIWPLGDIKKRLYYEASKRASKPIIYTSEGMKSRYARDCSKLDFKNESLKLKVNTLYSQNMQKLKCRGVRFCCRVVLSSPRGVTNLRALTVCRPSTRRMRASWEELYCEATSSML